MSLELRASETILNKNHGNERKIKITEKMIRKLSISVFSYVLLTVSGARGSHENGNRDLNSVRLTHRMPEYDQQFLSRSEESVKALNSKSGSLSKFYNERKDAHAFRVPANRNYFANETKSHESVSRNARYSGRFSANRALFEQ